ncbi:hypothetical protein Hanom_Chr05g00462151 [Helianthus anomalus]
MVLSSPGNIECPWCLCSESLKINSQFQQNLIFNHSTKFKSDFEQLTHITFKFSLSVLKLSQPTTISDGFLFSPFHRNMYEPNHDCHNCRYDHNIPPSPHLTHHHNHPFTSTHHLTPPQPNHSLPPHLTHHHIHPFHLHPTPPHLTHHHIHPFTFTRHHQEHRRNQITCRHRT